VDPLLVRDGRWLAETLLAETPPQGWPPARGGTLTRDAVYEALAARPLDLPADRLDPLGLLEWTLDEVRLARLDRLGEETRQGLLAWLGGRTGTTGCCTLAAVQTGNGGRRGRRTGGDGPAPTKHASPAPGGARARTGRRRGQSGPNPLPRCRLTPAPTAATDRTLTVIVLGELATDGAATGRVGPRTGSASSEAGSAAASVS
jgi:hypothetical protein